MKSKLLLIGFSSLLLLSILLAGCSNNEAASLNVKTSDSIPVDDAAHPSDTAPAETIMLSASYEPLTFYSFDEFADAVAKATPENDMYHLSDISYYYVPSFHIANVTLDAILVKDRYVCFYYYLENLNTKEFSSPDTAEIALISNTIKLEWVRNANGNASLEHAKTLFNLKELQNGIYYYDITYPTQPDVTLAKSIFWVYDGYMFNLDIPQSVFASRASAESLAEFINIQKISIKD